MDCSFSACSTTVSECAGSTTKSFPLLELVSLKPIYFPHYLILPLGRARKHCALDYLFFHLWQNALYFQESFALKKKKKKCVWGLAPD